MGLLTLHVIQKWHLGHAKIDPYLLWASVNQVFAFMTKTLVAYQYQDMQPAYARHRPPK